MKVSVDVYTKDIDAATNAFKKAIESGASDVNMRVNEDWDTKAFENVNLMFEVEHTSDAIAELDNGPFVKDSGDLD